MSDLSASRELNKGFGDGMSRAVELVLTPLVFGGLGFGLDLLAGTSPVFTVALAVFAMVGMFIRLWYGYDLEMRNHEASIIGRGAPASDDGDDTGDIWERTG